MAHLVARLLIRQVPHKTKSLMTALGDNWKLRPIAHATTRVLISGAGPTGRNARRHGGASLPSAGCSPARSSPAS